MPRDQLASGSHRIINMPKRIYHSPSSEWWELMGTEYRVNNYQGALHQNHMMKRRKTVQLHTMCNQGNLDYRVSK